jgi:16S rRNA (cytidine1402-2'-O)-methyltransferase
MLAAGLYIVATPIGNLDDISARALQVLTQANLILAEDTRHSSTLLQHYGISTKVQAFHEHNEALILPEFLQRLQAGQVLALISDAGTPLINDPGYQLVVAALAQNSKVIPVPGPSAVIAALSVAGLPTDRFVYEGYLPGRHAARRKRLLELTGEPRTMVFYEAPHRIVESLEDLVACFGPDRTATLAKEMTKYFETVRKESLSGLLAWLRADDSRQKGEFVLVVQGAADNTSENTETDRVLLALLRVLPVKQAAAVAAEILKTGKNALYKRALDMQQQ